MVYRRSHWEHSTWTMFVWDSCLSSTAPAICSWNAISLTSSNGGGKLQLTRSCMASNGHHSWEWSDHSMVSLAAYQCGTDLPGSPQWMAPELLCSLEAGLKPGSRKLESGDRQGFPLEHGGQDMACQHFCDFNDGIFMHFCCSFILMFLDCPHSADGLAGQRISVYTLYSLDAS